MGVESAVGCESAGESVFGDGALCEHPASVRQTVNSKTEFSQRNFMGGIVPLERTEFNKEAGRDKFDFLIGRSSAGDSSL